MDLKAPVSIFDETSDDVIESTGHLNLASGEITVDEIIDYDEDVHPCARDDYEYTYGVLKANGKEVEFGIKADAKGNYSVDANELEEIKTKLTKLLTSETQNAKPAKTTKKAKNK